MKQNNITNESLAEKTGLSRSSINRIRMGKGNPTVETLLILCNFFNVSMQEITGKKTLSHSSFPTGSFEYISNHEKIPFINWNTLSPLILEDESLIFYAIKNSQEYMNIPKNSTLIVEKKRAPTQGDIIILSENKSNIVLIAEYIKDIKNEYVSSILPLNQLTSEKSLVSLDNFQILGVVLETRKIFAQSLISTSEAY